MNLLPYLVITLSLVNATPNVKESDSSQRSLKGIGNSVKTFDCLAHQDDIEYHIGAPFEYWNLEECITIPDNETSTICDTPQDIEIQSKTSEVRCRDVGGKLERVDLSLSCTHVNYTMTGLPFCRVGICAPAYHIQYMNTNSTAFWGPAIARSSSFMTKAKGCSYELQMPKENNNKVRVITITLICITVFCLVSCVVVQGLAIKVCTVYPRDELDL